MDELLERYGNAGITASRAPVDAVSAALGEELPMGASLERNLDVDEQETDAAASHETVRLARQMLEEKRKVRKMLAEQEALPPAEDFIPLNPAAKDKSSNRESGVVHESDEEEDGGDGMFLPSLCKFSV